MRKTRTYHNFNLSYIAGFHILCGSKTIGDVVISSSTSSASLFAENVRLGIIRVRGRNLPNHKQIIEAKPNKNIQQQLQRKTKINKPEEEAPYRTSGDPTGQG